MDTVILTPILDDLPAKDDFLDFTAFAHALKDLITDARIQTPLTISITGSWGAGKTTLMSIINEALRKDQLATVWFEAWRYAEEEALWAAFLQSLLNQVGDNLPLLRKAQYLAKLYFYRTNLWVAVKLLVQLFFRLMAVLLPILLATSLVQNLWQTPFFQTLARFSSFLLAIGLSWIAALKPIIQELRDNVELDLSTLQKESDYTEHIAFLDKFREHFTDIVRSLPAKNNLRLTVFVDDLDRCSQDRVLEVLDAIKLFVDVPGCVYVIGIDPAVIQKAVAQRFKDNLWEQQKYLDKIIQLTLPVPAFLSSKIGDFIHEFKLDFGDPRCVDIFATGLSTNPREIKRALNLYFFTRYQYLKNHPESNRIHPLRMAKLVTIQYIQPELYAVCRRQPENLKHLENYFRLKSQTCLPDPLLVLHSVFEQAPPEEIEKMYYSLGKVIVDSALTDLEKLEQRVCELDSDNQFDRVIERGKTELENVDWDKIGRMIQAARENGTPSVHLPPELHPYRSDRSLERIFTFSDQDEGDNFSSVQGDEITSYFTVPDSRPAALSSKGINP